MVFAQMFVFDRVSHRGIESVGRKQVNGQKATNVLEQPLAQGQKTRTEGEHSINVNSKRGRENGTLSNGSLILKRGHESEGK